MATPPLTINLTAASAPGAPGTITLSAASGPGAPSTITRSAASAPGAPSTISRTAASTTSGATISGTLSPNVAGAFIRVSDFSGMPCYTSTGNELLSPPPAGNMDAIVWSSLNQYWGIYRYTNGSITGNGWTSTGAVVDWPNLVEGWQPFGTATGTPVVTLTGLPAPNPIELSPASQPPAPGVISR